MKSMFYKKLFGAVACIALAAPLFPSPAFASLFEGSRSTAFVPASTATPTAPTFDALGGVFAVLAVVAVIALIVLGYSLHRRNKDKDR